MRQITTNEVLRQLNTGASLNIIDVRELDEVREGMIPGAIHIPLNAIPARYLELDKNKEYIMVCRSGARSSQATAFLEQKGYQVINLKGGMENWWITNKL